MTENTAKPDLEALAETVRQRLHQNGQHGALAEFGKYTAAVQEQLASKETSWAGEVESKPEAPAAPAATPKAAAKPRAKKAAAK